jgi:hypothetical protein
MALIRQVVLKIKSQERLSTLSLNASVLAESPASGTLRMINRIELILNHVSPSSNTL